MAASSPAYLAMVPPETNGTQRELGQFFAEVRELRNDLRRLHGSVQSLDAEVRRVDRELLQARAENEKFRARLMTGVAVTIGMVSAAAWLVEIWVGVGA